MDGHNPKKEKSIGFRNALSVTQKKALLFTAASDKDICEILYGANVELEHFTEIDLEFWYFWNIVSVYYKKYKDVPNARELELAAEEFIGNLRNGVDSDTAELVFGLITEFRSFRAGDKLKIHTVEDYLRRLFSDRAWRDVQSVASVRNATPESITQTIDKFRDAADRIDSSMPHKTGQSFPKGFQRELSNVRFTPFGVDFMDAYLGGGGVAGEVYCLLGPIGGGKTTLLQQLSQSLAKNQLSLWESSNKQIPLGLSYFVSYELSPPVVRCRAIANAARIEMGTLMRNLPLSTRGNLTVRDISKFQDQYDRGFYIQSERERYNSAVTSLNKNWRFLDFSGFDTEKPGVGGGFVTEIMTTIDSDLRAMRAKGKKCCVSGVFIDYIGMMVKRHCSVNSLDSEKNLRYLHEMAADSMRRQLAHRFRCPVFAAHQLNAGANDLKPGQIPSMFKSKESNGIAENFDFVFVISRTTKDSSIGRLNCQKRRRMEELGDVVFRLDGQYARIVEVSDLWTWNENENKFIDNATTPKIVDDHGFVNAEESEDVDSESEAMMEAVYYAGYTGIKKKKSKSRMFC